MNVEALKKRLEDIRAKIQEAFEAVMENASDDDVRKYENLIRLQRQTEDELALAEKADRDRGGRKPAGLDEKAGETKTEKLSEREDFGRRIVEAVSLGTTFTGLLPRESASNIQMKKEKLARLRGLCTVHQASGDYTVLVEGDSATVNYVAENAQITESSPSVKPIGLSALKLAALVKVSREFMNDLQVDVMAYLEDQLARAFARKEDNEILFGAGTSSSKSAMRGIVTNAASGNIVTAAASDTVTWEEVKKMVHALKAYRTNATIVCSQVFLDIVHSFKDGDTYMFPQGQPVTQIMGIPVVVSDVFPTMAASTVVAVVGDFSYYHIMDRQSIEIATLYERYADYDQIGIRVVERIDGDFFQDAFAVLKTGTASSQIGQQG